MKTYTINTISDAQGFKTVISCDGVSKIWYGEFYPFTREIKQIKNIEVKEFLADGFNHALFLYQTENYKKSLKQYENQLRNRLIALENRILQKFGKKLKGKANKSKINSFLR